jgi:hypothetical protein
MAGTHNLASRLAQSVARRAKAGAGRSVASGASDQMLVER